MSDSPTLRAAADRIVCHAKYEPDRLAIATHTCRLDSGHAGAHVCPVCNGYWHITYGAVAR